MLEDCVWLSSEKGALQVCELLMSFTTMVKVVTTIDKQLVDVYQKILQPGFNSEGCKVTYAAHFCTPDLAPFMTFAVSDMNAMALEKSSPFFCCDSFNALKTFLASRCSQ